MIFGKRSERHQARKAEGREKEPESEKSDDGQPKAADDQDARAKLRAIGSEGKPKRKGHGRRAASNYSGAKIVRCRHEHLKAGGESERTFLAFFNPGCRKHTEGRRSKGRLATVSSAITLRYLYALGRIYSSCLPLFPRHIIHPLSEQALA